MDGTAELQIRMVMEGMDEALDLLKDYSKKVRVISDYYKDITKEAGKHIKQHEAFIDATKDMVADNQLLLRIHKDDHQEQLKMLGTLNKLSDRLREWARMAASGELKAVTQSQKIQVDQLIASVDTMIDSIKKASDATSEWNKALKETGLDKYAASVKQFFSVGGQIGLWSGMIAAAMKQTTEWRHQNYELYGSQMEIASAVRETQKQAKILQAEALAAHKALMGVAIDPATINEAANAVGRFHATTGASAETAALFYKRMQVAGLSSTQTARTLQTVNGAMARFGMTAAQADQTLKFLAENSRTLQARMGGTAEGLARVSQNMIMVSGMAVQAGMDLGKVQNIYDDLLKDATKYIVLLQDGLDLKDPSAQMLKMAGNAEEFLSSIEQAPGWMQDKLARSITNMGIEELRALKKTKEIGAEFAKTQGMTYDELVSKMGETGEGAKKLQEAFDKHRIDNDPAYKAKKVFDDFQKVLTDLGQAILPVVTLFLKLVEALLAIPGMNYIIMGFIILVGVLKLIQFTLGPFKTLWSLFSGGAKEAGKAVGDAGQQMAKAPLGERIKEFGKGIVGFFNEFRQLDMEAVWKAAGAMLIIGGAMIVLAIGARYVGAENLVAVGISLVAFAIALKFFAEATKNLEKDALKGAIAMAIMAGGVALLALAAKIASPGELIAASIGVIAMAGAMWILSKAAPQLAKAAPQIFIACLALLLLGAALIGIAYAMKVAEGVSWKTLAIMAIMIVVLVGAVLLLGYLAPLAIIGATVLIYLAVAMLILAAAMWVLAHAWTIFVKGLVELANIGLMKLAGELIVFSLSFLASAALLLVGGILLIVASIAIIIGGALLIPAAILLLIGAAIGYAGALIFKLMADAMAAGVNTLSGVLGPMMLVGLGLLGFSVLALASAVVLIVAAPLLLAAGVILIAVGAVFMAAFAVLMAAGIIGMISAIFLKITFDMLAAGLAAIQPQIPTMLTLGPAILAGLIPGIAGLAAIMPLAILAMIAAIFIRIALNSLLGALANNAPGIALLPTVGAAFGPAMSSLASGMRELVAAPYIRFLIAAKSTASGLRSLLTAIGEVGAGINLLPTLASSFAPAMASIAVGASIARGIDTDPLLRVGWSLFVSMILLGIAANIAGEASGKLQKMATMLGSFVNIAKDASGATEMVKLARATGTSLLLIATSFDAYAYLVERAANRVSMALLRVAGSMWLLRLSGMDDMIRTAAMVTVKTDIEDKKKEDIKKEETNNLLTDIKKGISELSHTVAAITSNNNVSGQLDEIKKIMVQWLPEIAESDKGLASQTNSWSSSYG